MKQQRKQKNKESLQILQNWLLQSGNSKSKLAAKLGYCTTTTIDQWFSRGGIPVHQEQKLLSIIRNNGREASE